MPLFRRGYGGYTFDITEYFPRAIKTLCLICIAVFVLQIISGWIPGGEHWWLKWFALVPAEVTHVGFVWQLGTYIFLHATIWHILFNLLYLVMFGAALEHMWGARKFTTYFFVCGIGAGLIDLIVRTIIDPHALGMARDPTIGASGAIYGVLLACAVIMPHRQVYLFPLPVTISMRLLVIILGAIEFLSTIGATGDNVSHVCHLGGMLVGYLYLRRGSFLYNVRNQVSDYQRRRLRRKFEVYARSHKDEPPSRPDNWVN